METAGQGWVEVREVMETVGHGWVEVGGVMETVGQGWVVVQEDGVQNSSQIAALICQKQVTLWVQGAASSEWWQRPDLLKCRSMTTGCGVPAHDGQQRMLKIFSQTRSRIRGV